MKRIIFILATMAFIFPGTAAAATTCDRTATTSTFASQLSAATAGQTVCLAAGTYAMPAASKSNVTVAPQAGAAVKFSSLLLNSNKVVSGVTFDGANGAGGLMDFADVELCAPSRDVTWRNARWSGSSVTIRTKSGAGSCGGTAEIVNANIMFDHDQFLNYHPSGGLEGRIHLPGATSASDSGITIQNSLFKGGDGDGIQSAATGLKILNNEFADLLFAGGPHTDAIQIWGAKNTLVQGNYLHNDSTGIMNYDGGNSGNVIADNVLIGVDGDAGFAVIQLGGGTNETVIHNTIVGAGKKINFGSKAGQQARNVTVRDNVVPGGVVSSGSGSAATYLVNDYNLCAATSGCAGSHAQVGTPVFTGGANPTSYNGFALASGSPGKGNSSDGVDRGIRVSGGTPPPPPPTDHAPVAAFTYQPASPLTGQAVNLDAATSTCEDTPCTYTWVDDGDDGVGGTQWPLGNGQQIQFTFAEAGVKNVRVTVLDSDGDTATVVKAITVGSPTPPPGNPTCDDVPECVQFRTQVSSLQGQVTTLQSQNTTLSNQNTSLTTALQTANGSIAALTTQVGDLTAANAGLQSKVDALQHKIDTALQALAP